MQDKKKKKKSSASLNKTKAKKSPSKAHSRKKKASQLDALSKGLSIACLVMLVIIVGIIVAIGLDADTTSEPFGKTEATTAQTSTEPSTQAVTKETTTQPTTVAPDEEGYTAVNETVYATEELNVRTGPGTSYEKVGRLSRDAEVTRVAVGDNGWSKILYEEEICFVSSDYLSTIKPVRGEDIADEDRIIVDPEQENWNLIVVNHSRKIPEGYTPKLAAVAGTDVMLDYRVAPYYTEMYNAAKADGITLTPYSGYRSYERQERNYNNRINSNISNGMSREDAIAEAASVILPPGTSEHNLGLAMDICNTKNSFQYQEEYAWLMENAHKYGFILRYTAEKQPITGIVTEPWHWRFVGVEYAEKIKNSGLCLEEYLDSVGIAY